LECQAFWDQTSARKLADWNPYDPQASADYFEPLWMFDRSLKEGFDIVIGNPPYVQIQKFPA
jgi:methylase of polypeptide subunit release factors